MHEFVGHFVALEGKLWKTLRYLLLRPGQLTCLAAYLPIAMRRVYGGSRLATAFKWLVLMTAHLLVVATSTAIAELIGIMGRS